VTILSGPRTRHRFLAGLPAGGWRPETVSGLVATGRLRHTAWFRP
jgi:hypothetical protein